MKFLTKVFSYLFLSILILGGSAALFLPYQKLIRNEKLQLHRLRFDAMRAGVISSLRGRVLDRNGKPLAWSVRYFSLYYKVPPEYAKFRQDIQDIKELLTRPIEQISTVKPGQLIKLIDEINPGEIIELRQYTGNNKRFQIQSSFRRVYGTFDPVILAMVGRVKKVDNREVGVSGAERAFNSRLMGSDGKYKVTVDKQENWIPETWEQIQGPVPGFDVYLPIGLE